MAYPIVSAPYGLKPVNAQGGRVYAGSTRMFPITNGFATNLFNGDVVGVGSGVLTSVASAYKADGSQTATAGAAVGVFVGAEYSTVGGPIYGKNRYQAYIGPQNANDIVGYVVDDPLAYFRVAVLTQGTTALTNSPGATIGYMNPYFVGSNAYLVTGNAGNVNTGDSAMGVSGGIVTNGTGNFRVTAATPFRIIQMVPDTAYTYTSTSTGSTSGTSTTVTLNVADTNIKAGMQLIAINPNGTYVSGVAPGNYVTVTNVNGVTLTVAGTGINIPSSPAVTLSFIGYPEVIIGFNAGYHAYNVSTGA